MESLGNRAPILKQPESLDELEAARGAADAVEERILSAIDAKREREKAEVEARQRFVDEIIENDEYTDRERAAWLLALRNSEDILPAAVAITNELSRVDEMVSQPGIPVIYATPSIRRRPVQMFHTSGEGMYWYICDHEIGGSRVGAQISYTRPDYEGNPGLTAYLPAEILVGAVTESEEVEKIQTKTHHMGNTYSKEKGEDVLVIGTDAAKAYLEKLFTQEADKELHGNESHLIEKLLLQTPPDSRGMILDSEKLQEWFEVMKADRLDLFAKHLSAFIGYRDDSWLPELPETKNQIAELYGIGPEDIRRRALELHEESEAKIRQKLEYIDYVDVELIFDLNQDET